MPVKRSPAVELKADKKTLLKDNFTTDAKGNILVKNKALNKALSESLEKTALDPNIAAIRIGVVVDF
ncbi:MAG: hypothetical protein AABO57_12540 [Acidobacteriota bacterium]